VIFKDHIQKYRKIDIEKVATGEHWYGADALSLGLIDEIGNSEDLILNKILSGYRVISIQYINNSKRAKRIISVLYNTIASLMMHHKSNLY
jgi:serine protease SohB